MLLSCLTGWIGIVVPAAASLRDVPLAEVRPLLSLERGQELILVVEIRRVVRRKVVFCGAGIILCLGCSTTTTLEIIHLLLQKSLNLVDCSVVEHELVEVVLNLYRLVLIGLKTLRFQALRRIQQGHLVDDRLVLLVAFLKLLQHVLCMLIDFPRHGLRDSLLPVANGGRRLMIGDLLAFLLGSEEGFVQGSAAVTVVDLGARRDILRRLPARQDLFVELRRFV